MSPEINSPGALRARYLTVTIGSMDSGRSYFADTRDSDTNTWLGVAYAPTPDEALYYLVHLIAESADDPQSHWWRF